MTALTSAVDLHVEHGVARVRLTSPGSGNAFDLELTEGLRLAARRLRTEPSVRAVLVTADGDTFSRGGDVSHFATHDAADYPDVFGDLMDRISEALLDLQQLDAPVVVAVQGWVVGAGLCLVGAADIVLAADDARFVTAFTGIGLPGDAGVSWFLTRLVGPRRAAALLLQNTPFSATEALAWGLVSELVPAAELPSRAEDVAARLAAGPTTALGLARRNVASALDHDLETHLALERAATVRSARTRDLIHAVEAFASRTTPTFEGR